MSSEILDYVGAMVEDLEDEELPVCQCCKDPEAVAYEWPKGWVLCDDCRRAMRNE